MLDDCDAKVVFVDSEYRASDQRGDGHVQRPIEIISADIDNGQKSPLELQAAVWLELGRGSGSADVQFWEHRASEGSNSYPQIGSCSWSELSSFARAYGRRIALFLSFHSII